MRDKNNDAPTTGTDAKAAKAEAKAAKAEAAKKAAEEKAAAAKAKKETALAAKAEKKNKTADKPTKPAKNNDKGSKLLNEKPEIGQKYDFRISGPHGYYPEDVDQVIRKFEKDVSDLEKENKTLSDDLFKTKENLKAATSELAQIKMQSSIEAGDRADLEQQIVDLQAQVEAEHYNYELVYQELQQTKMQMESMAIPDLSAEEGFTMLSRIDSITGNYSSQSVADMKMQTMQGVQPTHQAPESTAPAKPKIKFNVKPKS